MLTWIEDTRESGRFLGFGVFKVESMLEAKTQKPRAKSQEPMAFLFCFFWLEASG